MDKKNAILDCVVSLFLLQEPHLYNLNLILTKISNPTLNKTKKQQSSKKNIELNLHSVHIMQLVLQYSFEIYEESLN